MRPVLKPGLRRVWRDAETLQLGLDPERAVVLTGVEPAVARFIESLEHVGDARVKSAECGLEPAAAKAVLQMLTDAGALVDADRVDPVPDAADTPEGRRLAPDLRARSVLAGDTDPGTAVLVARRRAHVRVVGAARVGAGIAALLGAAGVGTLTVVDDTAVADADVTPLGPAPTDVGSARSAAVQRLLGDLAPTTRPARCHSRPDLVVFAPAEEADRASTIGLVRDGMPHLVTSAHEVTGVIGPLVLPGRSACLHCLDLYRTDRDAGWPSVLAQIQTSRQPLACDVALAAMMASLAALQALAFVDGLTPKSVDGTLTVGLPDGMVRRRSWRPHPACGCCWEHLAAPVAEADEPALF